jgi:ABC-type bacteriocin/lantibiotic exporter with double-glycine peptidase domain
MSSKILQVKPFQETLHGGYCGPASLKMVMDYFGKKVSEEEVAEKCGHDPELGIDDLSIKSVAEEYGFKVEIQNNSTYGDIGRWLAKEVPVIVDWFTSGRRDYDDSQVPDGHYSVVVGLDEENIYLQDPEIGGMRTIERDDFYRVWFDFKGAAIKEWNDIILRQIIVVYT